MAAEKQSGKETLVRYRIITRTTEQRDCTIVERLARCGHKGQWLFADGCSSCESFDGFERDDHGAITAMVCKAALPGGEHAEADAEHPAVKTPVRRLLRQELMCVQAETDALKGLELMTSRGLPVMAVVTDYGRPLGVVTREELGRRAQAGGSAPLSLREAMIAPVPAVRDHTSVADASVVLAGLDAPYAVVQAQDGLVVGVLSAGELLRWYVDHAHE